MRRLLIIVAIVSASTVAVANAPRGLRSPAFLALVGGPSLCGNGEIDGAEACDDGNALASDGCSSCAIDSGSVCDLTVEPSECGIFWLDVDGKGSGNPTTTLAEFGSMSNILACDGEDVVTTTLTCDTGGAAPEAGSSTSPTSGLAVPFTSTTRRGVSAAASAKFYALTSTSNGDVTTSDFAVEAVFSAFYDGTGNDVIIGKRDDGGTGNGWELAQTTATAVTLTLDEGGAQQTASCTIQDLAWQHVVCFADRDSATGMQCFCNGAAGTATDPTANANGTLTNTDPVRIQSGAVAGDRHQGVFAYARAWSGTGLATATFAAQAKDRAARAMGSFPRFAQASVYPTTMTRASVAVVDIDRDSDGVRRLFTVGNAWVPVARRKGADAAYTSGLMTDDNFTQLWDYSDDATNAAWTKTQTVATNGQTSPLVLGKTVDATADALESADGAGSVSHHVRQTPTLTAVEYSFSCFVKIGADTATHFWLDDETIANGEGWFNGSTCASTAQTQAGVEASGTTDATYGSGWCRIGIRFMGTAAAHTLSLGYSSASGTKAYDDGTDSAVDATIWRCQVNNSSTNGLQTILAPPVATVDATDVTQAQTDIIYTIANGTSTGSMEAIWYCPTAVDNPNEGGLYLYTSTSTDYIRFVNQGGALSAAETSNVSQWSLADAATLNNSLQHAMRITYTTNEARLYIDGILDASDLTSVTPPPAAPSIGLSEVGSCLQGGVRIWPGVVAP